MRLLLTTDTVGGVWTFTQELTSGFLRRGCRVVLVSFGRSPSADQRRWCDCMDARWGAAFAYHASEVPLEWMQDNARSYPEGAELLHNVARSFKPDLLLSSQYCYGALDLTIPKYVVAHSDVLGWGRSCRGGPLEPSPWLHRYESLVRSGLRRASGVIAPTQWMLDALGEGFPLPAEQHVIMNGRTLPLCSGDPERRLQAITAGRVWDEAKHMQVLAAVRATLPLLVAGDLAGQPCTFDGVTMLGQLAEHELLDAFRRSAIYICTSRYEPFGLAPLEAALCGCALVANDIPSLREVWGDAAFYFRDAATLSSLLAILCATPSALHAAQLRAKARAVQLTADNMVRGYLARLTPALQAQRGTVHAW